MACLSQSRFPTGARCFQGPERRLRSGPWKCRRPSGNAATRVAPRVRLRREEGVLPFLLLATTTTDHNRRRTTTTPHQKTRFLCSPPKITLIIENRIEGGGYERLYLLEKMNTIKLKGGGYSERGGWLYQFSKNIWKAKNPSFNSP